LLSIGDCSPVSSTKKCIKLTDSTLYNTEASYTFYVKATAKGGASGWFKLATDPINSQMTFKVACFYPAVQPASYTSKTLVYYIDST